ncbi:MAG: UvrB/UvrC motif-containing protein [Elusimicrobiota bacterium]
MGMICNICHKNESEIQLKGIFNEKTIKIDMCQECARKKGFESNPEMALIDFINAIHSGTQDTRQSRIPVSSCLNCGTTLSDLRQKGLLGCEKCYSNFGPIIVALLEHIHRCHKHCGKRPGRWEKIFSSVTELELQKNLEKAVKQENYELAAHLRDELQKAGVQR